MFELELEQDQAKLHTAVNKLLDETLKAGKTICFASPIGLLKTTEFQIIDENSIIQEIRDYTCSIEFGKMFGTWVFTEFGDGYCVFSRLAEDIITVSAIEDGQYPRVTSGGDFWP